jgi:hypothetical protein
MEIAIVMVNVLISNVSVMMAGLGLLVKLNYVHLIVVIKEYVKRESVYVI